MCGSEEEISRSVTADCYFVVDDLSPYWRRLSDIFDIS